MNYSDLQFYAIFFCMAFVCSFVLLITVCLKAEQNESEKERIEKLADWQMYSLNKKTEQQKKQLTNARAKYSFLNDWHKYTTNKRGK